MHRLLVLLMTVGLAGCGSSDDLAFDIVDTCLSYEQPSERVFASSTEWQEAHRTNGTTPAPPVDFSQRQVAARFDGGGSACTTFSVERVEVEDGAVVVRATRYQSTQPCILILAHPQIHVSMPRRDEPVRFAIRDVSGGASGPIRACR